MVNRVTLAGLASLALDGAALGFKVSYLMRATKVMCSVEISGLPDGVAIVAGTDGSVRYWSGVSAALFDLVTAARPVAGNYSVVIEGAGLVVPVVAKTKAERINALNKSLMTNAAAEVSANDKVSLLADVPNMVACLEAERVELQNRMALVVAEP